MKMNNELFEQIHNNIIEYLEKGLTELKDPQLTKYNYFKARKHVASALLLIDSMGYDNLRP